MKEQPEAGLVYLSQSRHVDRNELEIRRANARLRHFRGVAAGVMAEAQKLWREIWDDLQDPRTPDEILEGKACPCERLAGGDGSLLLEKLHLLGIQIDYARRLCEGSIGNESHEQGVP